MHVIFTSQLYHPVVGGSVIVLDRLARGLRERGDEVSVLTATEAPGRARSHAEWREAEGIRVCRPRDSREAWRILREADRVVMIEMSLGWWWRALAAGRRPLVTHHTHSGVRGGVWPPRRALQRAAGLVLPSLACSAMIARQWGPHVGVLPNPYDERLFRDRGGARDLDFLFAGRLVSDKGAELFVEALGRVARERPGPRFAIAGDGALRGAVEQLIDRAGLRESLVFLGQVDGEGLAELYNRARHVVVPSLWREPFGLVAIEALACGAGLICSDQPGLREASGGLARHYPTGDVEALAAAMAAALAGEVPAPPVEARREHLARYRIERCLEVLDGASRRWNNRVADPSPASPAPSPSS